MFILFTALFFNGGAQIINRSVNFSFTLSVKASTSAGVYKSDSTLVRTLWGGISYEAGVHAAKWDGVDDDGRLAPDGSYQVRVLSNNVKYKWEGVLGNTSDSSTGPGVHHGMDVINCIAFSGSKGYYARNYNEKEASQSRFDTARPQLKIGILPVPNAGQGSRFVVADNTNVFWAGNDPNADKWFVFATGTGNDAETIFTGSTPLQTTYGRNYPGAIDVVNASNGAISGLAVQKNGSYLFVSHQGLNEIHVINKATGSLTQIIAISAPAALATDGNNALWVTYANNGLVTVENFTVASNGTLSPAAVAIAGLINPLSLAVSPDDATLLVADGGNSQQLKAYNNIDGTMLWTFGQVGGYFVDATVTDDKFYFSDARRVLPTFIAFQADGSFWVGDPGNSRSQHYTAGRNLINRIMYLGASYKASVDMNNPVRVFSDYLEFKIDYAKPLQPGNGSWTLVKNWGAVVPISYDDRYIKMKGVATLSNGRTYGTVLNFTTNRMQVVELPASGPMRITATSFPRDNSQLYPDGALYRQTMIVLGAPTTWSKQPLTGFDAAGDPLWGASTVVASSPPATRQDPLFWGNLTTLRSGEVTSSGVVVAFDGALPANGSDGWHLGGIKKGTGKWLWRTAMSTNKLYTGPFPADGAYDNGNLVVYPGSMAMAMDRSIFWGYHGEFWKNTQTNKWNQVYDDGLFIGQFGTVGLAATEAAAQMAGNSMTGTVVKDANGDAYLYHNDESCHSGIHRWKITGLNTISEATMPVVLSSATHGLLGQYYSGKDLDNANIKTVRIDPAINFNWGTGNPTGTAITNVDLFSISWTGFVQPLYSETYTFYTITDDGARLWIDGKLIIDFWQSGGNRSGQITLESGKRYSIRMEYNENQGGASAALFWSSPSQVKAVVPASVTYPADAPDRTKGQDLLEGLTGNNLLESNLYGWVKTPAANDSIPYNKWWIAKAGVKSYQRFMSPDLYVKFKQPTGNYSLMRNLASFGGQIQTWTVSGRINYDENFENHDLTGGGYFEVLDTAGKIISRLYTKSVWNDIDPIISVYVNNQLIVQGGRSVIQPILQQYQPFTITVNASGVTVKLGPFAPVTTAPLDAQSNWKKPKILRLSFWTTTSNYDRIIDLEGLRFSTTTMLLVPDMLITTAGKHYASNRRWLGD